MRKLILIAGSAIATVATPALAGGPGGGLLGGLIGLLGLGFRSGDVAKADQA